MSFAITKFGKCSKSQCMVLNLVLLSCPSSDPHLPRWTRHSVFINKKNVLYVAS